MIATGCALMVNSDGNFLVGGPGSPGHLITA